jgi:serine/threonine-protein kinase RsbW
MQPLLHKKMPAVLDSLYEIMDGVSDCAAGQDIRPERIEDIKLSLEEILVNIFNYAYPKDRAGDVEITCSLSDQGDFIIEIKDSGAPFDMLSVAEPDIDAPIEDRRIGGLGIFFVKQFIDDIRYSREENCNVLTLAIRKEQPPPSHA